MSIMVGVGRGAREGVLVKNAEALESLEKVDTIVIDKTGTLTEGKPKATKVVVGPGLDENAFLRVIGSLEQRSEHPLAAAVVRAAQERGLALAHAEHFDSVTGGGVVGQVEGQEVVVGNSRLLESRGTTGLDSLKTEAERLQLEGSTVVYAAFSGNPA